MKIFDGNYKRTMVTIRVMNELKRELCRHIIFEIKTCNFILSDENIKLLEEWMKSIDINELVNLKLYGDYSGYDELAIIINDAINEFAEER